MFHFLLVHTLYFPFKATAPVSAEQITFIIFKKNVFGYCGFQCSRYIKSRDYK